MKVLRILNTFDKIIESVAYTYTFEQKTKAPCKGKSVLINAFTLAGRLYII